MKGLVLGIAASALVTGAHAADIETSEAYDWSGPYLGLHAGYGWSDTEGLYDNGTGPGPYDFDESLEGGLVGAQIGYNMQIDSIVFGIEADGSVAGLDERTTLQGIGVSADVDISTETLASIRGRLGWAFGNTLIYGTAGLGYAEHEFSVEQSPKIDLGPNGTLTENDWNFVYGGGIEHAIDNVRVRLEYLHYDTSVDHDFFPEELVDTDEGDFVEWDGVDVVRFGVSFGFGAL